MTRDEAVKQRIRDAAKAFEDALNEDGGALSVNVTGIECTGLHDDQRRFRYVVSIERTERIR